MLNSVFKDTQGIVTALRSTTPYGGHYHIGLMMCDSYTDLWLRKQSFSFHVYLNSHTDLSLSWLMLIILPICLAN